MPITMPERGVNVVQRHAALASLAVLALIAAARPASAQVTQIVPFREVFSTQTGTSGFGQSYYFFSDHIVTTNPDDITTGQLTYPGSGSPVALTNNNGVYGYGAPLYTSLAAFDAAFPTGNYTTSWGGGTAGSGQLTIAQGPDIYPNVPLFTPATFNALTGSTGLYAGLNNTLNWNLFTPNGAANANYIFFSISNNSTSATVFGQNFVPATQTSLTIPAGTLTPNTTYSVDLDFSSRINNLITTPVSFQGYDENIGVTFTTATSLTPAVPEPSAVLLVTLGLLPLGLRARLRRS